MELDDLLFAITEVSGAVSRMPCASKDKEQVLGKIGDLFFKFNAVSNKYANCARPSESKREEPKEGNPKAEQTLVKGCWTSTGSPELGQIQERVQSMNGKLNELEQKLARLERDQGNKEMTQSISSLRSEISAQVETFSQMRATQDTISNRVARIENKANDLEVLQTRIQQIQTLVDSKLDASIFATELLKMHQDVANLEGLIKEKDTDNGTEKFVAFSAKVKNTRKYTDGDIVHFQNVVFDFNSCYDSSYSMFKTKFLGWYFFSTSINTNSRGDFEAAIMHNNDEVALFGTPGDKDLQTGTSVVLKLQPGDTVCVKMIINSSVEVGSGFSNFIGYKIA